MEKQFSLSYLQFKNLFNEMYPALCYFAYKYVNDVELSKDLVQDVFLKIWENKIKFEHPDKIKSFLYTSVKNKALDYLKSLHNKKMDREKEPSKDIQSKMDFLMQITISETTRIIDSAVKTLPRRCSEVIQLSLKDYSNKEISEELSISINTVKVQKRIAYDKLRKILNTERY